MNPISALPVTAGLPLGEDLLAAQPGAAQGADFSALLAIETLSGGEVSANAAADPAPLPVTPEAAAPASALPAPGKILPLPIPPGLPQAAPEAAEPQAPEALTVPVPHRAVARAVAHLLRKSAAEPDPAKPREAEAATDETDAPPLPVVDAAPVDVPLAPLTAQLAHRDAPNPAPVAPHTEPSAPGAAGAIVPAPLPAARPPVVVARRTIAASPAQPALPAPPQAVLALLAPAAALPPVARLQIAPGAAAIAVEPQAAAPAPSAVVGSARMPAALREDQGDPAPALAAQAPAQPAPFATPASSAEPSAQRPHDFAALVDRITAARDASSQGAVSVAMAHSDFGQVQLRFRHQDGALSVAMASPDPEFTRAVSALPPVVQTSASTGENTGAFTGQPGGRDAALAQHGGGSGTFAQQRGSAAPQRAADERVLANPSQPRGKPDPAGRQSGIFA